MLFLFYLYRYLIEPPSNLVNRWIIISTYRGILPKGPYPPCLRMADRALLAGYSRYDDGCKECNSHNNTQWIAASRNRNLGHGSSTVRMNDYAHSSHSYVLLWFFKDRLYHILQGQFTGTWVIIQLPCAYYVAMENMKYVGKYSRWYCSLFLLPYLRLIISSFVILNTLPWGHNERDGVSNHQRLHCLLLKCWLRRRSNETSTHRVTGLCEGNSPVIGEFPAQKTSNAENVSILWRHHAQIMANGSDFPFYHFHRSNELFQETTW